MSGPETCGCESARAGRLRHEALEDLNVKSPFRKHDAYQSDCVVRCRNCGQHWLEHYTEWDDEATRLEEWGHRFWARVKITPEQLKRIIEAGECGEVLNRTDYYVGVDFSYPAEYGP